MTSTTSESVITVASSAMEHAVATIVTAFTADPPMRWVLPDPQQYLTYAPEFVRRFCSKAFEDQSAFAVGDFRGAALWLRPSVEPDGDGLAELMQEAVAPSRQNRVFEFFEQIEQYHPQEPVWYLAMIGVDPAGQGWGWVRLYWRIPSLRSTVQPSQRILRLQPSAAATCTLATALR